MSFKEEDRNKPCPSRGLGIAAAAIGVGVGAALYYFFNKRPENPADEGATSSGWNCEQPHTLHDSDSSYTTISEHSTTDTSILDTSSDSESNLFTRLNTISKRLWHSSSGTDIDSDSDSDSDSVFNNSLTEDSASSLDLSSDDVSLVEQLLEPISISESNEDVGSDSDGNMEWDVTTSSLDVPSEEPRSRSPIMMQFGDLTVRLLNPQDTRWNRERSWALEECSICFEDMLKHQEILSLACTHRFHQACIMPWLQEQQTCPMCRKAS